MATLGKTHKFANDSALVGLLREARRISPQRIIIDDTNGYQKTYGHLLADIIATRDLLLSRLPAAALNEQGLLRDDYLYIALLSKTGYEFLVGFFAIRALGGACMPTGYGALPEAAYLLSSKTGYRFILAGVHFIDDASGSFAPEPSTENVVLAISTDAEPINVRSVTIDEALLTDPTSPGLVPVTSGTTGPSKRVVLTKSVISTGGIFSVADEEAVAINNRPCHWIGGIMSLLFPVLCGKKLIVLQAGATAADLLETLRINKVDTNTYGALELRQMRLLIEGPDGVVSEENRRRYGSIFAACKWIQVAGSLLDQETAQFWADFTGKPFGSMYATTELATVTLASKNFLTIKGALGKPTPNAEAKLSPEGELLAKNATVMIGYYNNEKATRAAFDEDGFYRTGDLAEIVDGEFVFRGRLSDSIKVGTNRFPAIDVEQALLALPYAAEACVLPLGNESEGTSFCGAVVRLKGDEAPEGEDRLARIRADLSKVLADYKIPSVCHFLRDGESLAQTPSGKLMKRQITEDFFEPKTGLLLAH